MSKITIYSPPATAQIKACAVDFDLRRAPVPVHLVQYDKTIPILAVSLYKGSSPYTLPADAEVNVRMNKRNNLCVYNPALGCNESRDVAYVAVTPQMTTQDGTFEPILEVVINSGVAGTSPMQLVIRSNPVQEDAIEDTSEAKTLTELVSQAAASATAAAQSAGAAAEDAGKAAASATAAAESDEHAAATAQNIKDSLDQIASNAAAVSQLKEATAKLKDGKISKFYASSQGNTNLPDSDDGRIVDLMLYGRSEQKQYSGKNLLPRFETTTSASVTFTVDDNGVVTANGTATGFAQTAFDLPNKTIVKLNSLVGTTLYLSGAKSAKKGRILLHLDYKDNSIQADGIYNYAANSNTSFALKGTVNGGYAQISGESGSAFSGDVFYPMLSTSSDTDYEPYVGGIPSPNPEYPQEIKSVVNPVVKVTGKNLLKTIHWETQTVSGVTIEKTSDTVFKISGTATGEVVFNSSWGQGINVPAQSYLLCKILHGSCPAGSKVTFFTANYDAIASEIGEISPLRTSAISCGLVRFAIKKGSSINCTVGLSIQMDTSTDYEPYTEQTAALPYTLNAIPVTSGGNVTIDGQQYIADYVDVERGKLVRMCKEVDFEKVTPSSEINVLTNSREVRFLALEIGIKQLPSETPNNEAGFITSIRRLTPGTGTWNIDEVGVWQCGQGSDTSNLTMRVPPEAVIGYIEYIKSIGGCKGVFQAATPTETDLTADEIAGFKALVSHYPVTNVSTTSDQLDGYTVFDYPISLANGWNYVKQQLGDTRDYLYGIDLMTAEAYVNSEYAAALAEIEV